jgi:hypothetical protein
VGASPLLIVYPAVDRLQPDRQTLNDRWQQAGYHRCLTSGMSSLACNRTCDNPKEGVSGRTSLQLNLWLACQRQALPFDLDQI